MQRSKKAGISVLAVLAFVAALCAYKPFTDLLASSSLGSLSHVASRWSQKNNNHDQVVSDLVPHLRTPRISMQYGFIFEIKLTSTVRLPGKQLRHPNL